MSQSLPPEILTPEGRPAFLNPYSGTYTTSRAYARRMQAGYERGLPQAIARGQPLSESARRRERFERDRGIPYRLWERWRRKYIAEINYRSWRRAPRTRFAVSTNGVRTDPRVFPEDLAAARALYESGYRDPVYPDLPSWEAWVELRLAERLQALIEYQDFSDYTVGRRYYFARSDVWDHEESPIEFLQGFDLFAAAPPIELWWYH